MALPPTAAGASALAATARSRLAPRPRRSAVRGEAPGPTPGMGAAGDATTTMATGSGQVGAAGAARNALGLKGFRLATGSPTTTMSTMSRSDPAPDSLRSAVEGGGAGGFTGTSVSAPMSSAPGMADRARQALGMDGSFSPREIGGASPFIPESIQADAEMRRMTADAPGATIQGRQVNSDGTITGANGGTQQLGEAARRRLGMGAPSGSDAEDAMARGIVPPRGLKGFRAAMPYDSDAITRPLGPQPVEPPTDAPLPTSFRRRRPDIGGGALGGF